MADGGAGRGDFDWPGYFKVMGLFMLVLVSLVVVGVWTGVLQ